MTGISLMLFFEQDRITTARTSTSSTKPIATIGTIVVVVVADGVFVGTVVAVMITVADGDFFGTVVAVVMAVLADGDFVGTVAVVMAAVADDDVLVEHIDPDEPENMKDSCALKRIQAWPQSVRLKDVAHKNIYDIEVARDTSHSDRSALKDVAP